jgi:alkyl sulfatase BDS1-like metallo-beta-lactamase superfamily hydrolase
MDNFGGIPGSDKPARSPVDGVWMVAAFGNTGIIETEEGLLLVDVPAQSMMPGLMKSMRAAVSTRVHTVFLTHGHFDHAFSLEPVFQEAARQGHPAPRVIAQRNVLKRLNKYRMLHGYHEHINRIQFRVEPGQTAFPYPEYNPDLMFDESISFRIGALDFHAYHQWGETDDAAWVWVPEKRTILAGDLVVWSFPNVGNPFKVQRYTVEWAEALEAMVAKEPEILIPGHGPLLEGREKIRDTLLKISGALRFLHREVVDRLNRGLGCEEILHEVKLPADMLDNKFLTPRYGCPNFVVHGILRQYTGWYDGNPSNLFPPRRKDLAREIADLVGTDQLLARAERQNSEGRHDLALQFLDMALSAGLDEAQTRVVHGLKAGIFKILAEQADSFIAQSIYQNGHRDERAKAGLAAED